MEKQGLRGPESLGAVAGVWVLLSLLFLQLQHLSGVT